jgi:hypothetical protein
LWERMIVEFTEDIFVPGSGRQRFIFLANDILSQVKRSLFCL